MYRILMLTCIIAALALPLSTDGFAKDLVGQQLAERLAAADGDELISVIIVMKDRPDLDAIEAQVQNLSKAERRSAVCDSFKAHAAASQSDIRSLISANNPQAAASQVKYLWINNTIAGWLTASLIEQIAGREDVLSIRLNIPRQVFSNPGTNNVPALLKAPPASGRALVWSLPWIGVDSAWALYGVDGTGVTVAMVDTGTDYNHSDLNNNIWVNPAEDLDSDGVVWDSGDIDGIDNDLNGYVDDLVGYDFGLVDNNPMDDYGHGTHCSGTVGGNGMGGTHTGVAPNCNLMVCKVGYWIDYSDEASMWEGWEYAADNGADVISMSMRWAHAWAPHRSIWRDTAIAVKAAGVTLVVAAGNERGYYYPPNCVGTPPDCPEVFAIGATGYMTNNYASFSSNGPTVWEEPPPYNDHPYPPGLVKPDVAAPGESVVSTAWGGGYTTMSGTSMATPHIAGVCALVLDANPDLTPDEVQQILESTAMDLGSTGKDNDYGSGLVQTPFAVQEALLHGSNDPVPNIKVNGSDGPLSINSSTLVTVTVTLDPGALDGDYADWWIYGEKDSANTWWCRWNAGNPNWSLSAVPIRFAGATLRAVTDVVVAGPRYLPVGSYVFTFSVDEKNGIKEDTYTDTVLLTVY